MAQKIVGVGKVWAGIFCAQNHPSLCQICAGFWWLFSLWWFWSSSLWPFFSHGFRVLKADSISNVFSPRFFGTKVEVFGPWFLCAHFSMDLTSKIIYPLLVGGVVLKVYTCNYQYLLYIDLRLIQRNRISSWDHRQLWCFGPWAGKHQWPKQTSAVAGGKKWLPVCKPLEIKELDRFMSLKNHQKRCIIINIHHCKDPKMISNWTTPERVAFNTGEVLWASTGLTRNVLTCRSIRLPWLWHLSAAWDWD